jgi:hypothetical protein
VIPVRNQILEIDLVNTTTGGTVDAQATTGVGYTVSQQVQLQLQLYQHLHLHQQVRRIR